MTTIESARPEHIGLILDNLRDLDRLELDNPAETMAANLYDSEGAWTGNIDNVAACMFGVLPGGILWLIGTKQLERKPRLFLRECKKVLPMIALRYPQLIAYVHPANTVSASWLLWLGFNAEGEENGFMRFNRRRG